MFVDYVSLLLVNMVAGYFLLALYVYRGLDDPLHPRWAPGFGMVGLIALVFGTHMTATWPIIGSYNSAFGEMSVLFGAIFLAAAVSIAFGWSLLSVTIFAFFAGTAAIVLGARFIDMKMTMTPLLSGIGFIVSGLAGVFAAPTLLYFRTNRLFRCVAVLILLAAAAIWASIVYYEYWMHMESFTKWMPMVMRDGGGSKY